jgi:DNA-binding beta-propeller fold protein YncE
MGPTLWSSDFDIFARSNPEAVRYLGGTDLGSHLDMLHESPHCMGVSWEAGNAYWVFEGDSSSIARVDFQEDHGPGFDDHSDGIVTRYAVGEVARMASFPSHLHYEHATGRLYIADTGNKRVGVLDTMVEPEAMIYQPVVEPGTQLLLVDGGPSVETLFQDEELMRGPTGLTMHDGVLYVSDTATGRIVAFNPETGEVLDWLDTGISSPGLMGITFDAEGELYAVDGLGNRVLRFSARP